MRSYIYNIGSSEESHNLGGHFRLYIEKCAIKERVGRYEQPFRTMETPR
jgi:hypothetical protein